MEDKEKKSKNPKNHKKPLKSDKSKDKLNDNPDKQNDNEKMINKITLECLMNDTLYEKYVNRDTQKKRESDQEFLEDLSFYNKRIVNLTRELLKSITDQEYRSQYRDRKFDYLRDMLSIYSRNLIEYFKHEDTRDIIQEEINKADLTSTKSTNPSFTESDLKINPGNLKTILESDLENLTETIDKRFAHQKADKYDWNRFVVKRTTDEAPNGINSTKNIIIPQITEIDLKNPELKTKGIREKKKKSV